MKMTKEKNYIVIFALIWLILILVLPWRGFFLLNDDYVYEWNVLNFPARGFKFHSYTGPTLIFQVILALPLYAIRQDPGMLRLLTSLFFVLGAIYLFKLLCLEKISVQKSFLLALLLLFNPLYLYLGFTFMSDVYFLSMAIASTYYFVKAHERPYFWDSTWTMVFWGFSYLSRQQAIFLIPVYLALEFLVKGKKKKNFGEYWVYLIPLIVILGYEFFFPKTVMYTDGSIIKSLGLLTVPSTYAVALERLIKTLFYFGFFAFPIVIPLLFSRLLNGKFFQARFFLTFFSSATILSLLACVFWAKKQQVMFYIPNVLTYAGFLPASLHMGIKQTIFVNSPVMIGAVITLISLVSFSGLLALALPKVEFRHIDQDLSLWVWGLTTILIVGGFLLFRSYYDRYLIIGLPFLALMLGKILKEEKLFLPEVALVLFLGIVSVAFEHDYLSLTKTVWDLPQRYNFDELKYYSTFEHNSYYRLNAFSDAKSLEEIEKKSWMPKKSDYEFYASYIPIKGYRVVEEVNYKSLISPNFVGSLFLLKKN